MTDNNRPAIPFVPLNSITVAANIVNVWHNPHNDAIFLCVIEQRSAPITTVGEQPIDANFEIGRFMLTPCALRMLIDSALNAEKSFAETQRDGALPSNDQYNARGFMPGLLQMPDQRGGG